MVEPAALEKELRTKFQGPKQKAWDDRVLMHGPMGTCLGADPPREIDGQPITVKDGDLIISCEQSPYHEMKLLDYFCRVVRPFHETYRARQAEMEHLPMAERPLGHGITKADWPKRPEEL